MLNKYFRQKDNLPKKVDQGEKKSEESQAENRNKK